MPVAIFGTRDRERYHQETEYSTYNRTLRAHTEQAVVARMRSAREAAYIAHITAGTAGEACERGAPRQALIASISVSDGAVSFLGPSVVSGSFEVVSRRRGEVTVRLSNPGSLDITYGLSVRFVKITAHSPDVLFP